MVITSALLHYNKRYLILAPKFVRPDITYKVAVIIYENQSAHLNIHATITCSNVPISASTTGDIDPVSSVYTLLLQIPMSVRDGKYTLKVEGKHAGIPVFMDETALHFSPSFLSIVVQTSRPIYRAGQTVLFRILILHTDLKPFNDGVEVHLLDPDGFIMKRWLSAYTNNGVASLEFKLPKMTKDGFWKIQIKAWDQIEETKIKVETYFSPLFEVRVKWPPYFLSNEEVVTAYISGLFTSEKIAKGNATIKLSGRNFEENGTLYDVIWTGNAFINKKNFKFEFPLSTIQEVAGYLEGLELRLDVCMTEFLYSETVSGYSTTRIIPSELQIRFLTTMPAVFRPGLPFHTQIAVYYQDYERVAEDILGSSLLEIQATLYSDSGGARVLPKIIAGLDDNSEKVRYTIDSSNEFDQDEIIYYSSSHSENFLETGILPIKFDTRNDTNRILLSAVYSSSDGSRIEAKLEAFKHHSVNGKYIGVYSSTMDAVVGEYAIFHVRSNFVMDSFQYLVVSKDQILLVGEKSVSHHVFMSTASLALPVSAEMAPGFKLVIVHSTRSGEILTDSCFLPVDGFSRYEMEIELNTGKDLKAERVELRFSGEEAGFIGAHSVRAPIFELQAGNEMTKSRVTDSLLNFENFKRSLHKVKRKSRDGTAADESIYFSSPDYGRDARESFRHAGLFASSTKTIPTDPSVEYCKQLDKYACLSVDSCYTAEEKCNGVPDCEDYSDEVDCFLDGSDDEAEYHYKISRFSRFTYLYDADDGDWGWREIKKNDHEGIEFEPLWPPQVADDWYLVGFTVGEETGFTVIPEPVVFSYKRPFTMHVSGPSFCRRGEQLGMRLVLINNDLVQALVLVQLIGSPDYKFVHVDPGGIVSSYNARLLSGDHQVLVYLAPESQEHIDFPVAPTIEQGEIEIVFVASTQMGKSEARHTVKVIGEGALISRHTAEFLDLKSRALSLHYLNIIVEESPIVSYQEWRRYVYGSPNAKVVITGDLIGPAFPEMPITMESVLNQHGKGTETRLFEMAANVWTLHYLRLTNQLQQSTAHDVLDEINTLYAHVMKRYNSSGWFYNWNPRNPSVWLTAWALRIFKQATFPDWENILYIDSDVFARSVDWLLKFQTYSGSFNEYPLANYIDSKVVADESDISLTVNVLITIQEIVASGLISGDVRAAAVDGVRLAMHFLERRLSTLTDPYLITITTYALTITNSDSRDLAFLAMQQASRQNTEGLVYWARDDIPPNPVKIENQRPFKQPRLYRENDSIAVEMTSWALLVNLYKDGVTDYAEKIVKWLTTIRMTRSGFISTVDTIIALQALTEYAFRTRLLDITNINAVIEMPNVEFKDYIHIGNSSFEQPSEIDVPSVWGHVNIIARGAGQALVQLEVNYGIDYEPLKDHPTKPCFDLRIKEFYSTYRNKSAITIESCFRWVRDWPVVSGAAVLEIELPTGYHLVESDAEEVVRISNHPTLSDAQTEEAKTIWFFEYVEQEWSCFNHTVKRWYPVANMTLYRQALMYEMTARERFEQVLVNSTPLYVLNICEVCGSYQCPYCPFYNRSNFRCPVLISVLLFVSFNILYTKLLSMQLS